MENGGGKGINVCGNISKVLQTSACLDRTSCCGSDVFTCCLYLYSHNTDSDLS